MKEEREIKFKRSKKYEILFYLFFVISIIYFLCIYMHKHSFFEGEETFGFYIFFGFFSSGILILVAKVFRIFVKREEDYYDKP